MTAPDRKQKCDLIDCIKQNDPSHFVQLINNIFTEGKNISARTTELNRWMQSQFGSPLLHQCAKYNAWKICQFVCDHLPTIPTIINERDSEGKTPLHVSCILSSLECAKILLKNGADVNALKRGDWTALMTAVTKVDLDLVNLLLQHGADLCLCNKGLYQFVSNFYFLFIELFLNLDGWNTIHLATRTGDISLLRLLEEHTKSTLTHIHPIWAAKSKNGRNILHIAATNKHIEVVKYLLHQSSIGKYLDYQCKDSCGVSPFVYACGVNSVELCQILYKHSSGNLPVEDRDQSGRTALHIAAQTNACDVIYFLVNTLRCDLNAKDIWQQTPLFLAVREGHVQAVKLLIELGATKPIDIKGRSPLQIATIFGHQNKLSLYLA